MRQHTGTETAKASTPATARTPRRTAAKASLPAPDRPLALESPPSLALLEAPSRDELIRQRAYALYERNGCIEGRATEDWLEAEAELRAAEARAAEGDVTRTLQA